MSDEQQAIPLRRTLHQFPELAGSEEETARRLQDYLLREGVDELVPALGGHGFAVVFEGSETGPTIMLRAELDALPIDEGQDVVHHRSTVPGVSHKCGHDGHMAILAAVGASLSGRRPRRGRVVLLFQPAEETGEGARRVLDDERFARIAPDFVFALHNLPGYALGEVLVRSGTFAAASRGLIVSLTGSTAHAAEPDRGRSPALATAQLIEGLIALPSLYTGFHDTALVTVVGARLGDRAFGTSPGIAEVFATFRTCDDDELKQLWHHAERLVSGIAAAHDLEAMMEAAEDFPATINDPGCVDLLQDAAIRAGCPVHEILQPFPWSEDFGHFTQRHRGALFGLGAGENHPALHSPYYDFPDDLIEIGAGMFLRLTELLVEGWTDGRGKPDG